MLKRVLLAILIILIIVFGVFYVSGIGILYPSQVDSSMSDTVVKVKGKVTYTLVNPAGLGGIYLTLSDNGGDVDVRIQDDIWQSFDDNMKAKFSKGEIVIVEGVLFYTREALIVIHGKYSTSSNTTSK
ncbi:OB-fold nucleic acid binding domain-containing protein [Chloroflexota bacterium]